MIAAAPTRPPALPVLRPLTAADVLDGGFRIIRAAPAAVAVPALVVAVLATLLRLATELLLEPGARPGLDIFGTGAAPSAGPGFWASTAVGAVQLVISLTGAGVVAGFVTAVAMATLSGRPPTLADGWATVRRRLPAVVGLATAIAGLETLALPILVVPGVLLWTVWCLAVPALVMEQAGPVRALRRSWRLVVRGSFWRVFGLRLLTALVALAFTYLVEVPFGAVAGLIGGGGGTSVAALALTGVGSLLTAAVTLPIRAGVDVMLYLDQRVRREAFDIVLRLAE